MSPQRGAQWRSILSAVDKRMKMSVLLAGVAEIADILLRGNDPGLVEREHLEVAHQLKRTSLSSIEQEARLLTGVSLRDRCGSEEFLNYYCRLQWSQQVKFFDHVPRI
jgi:hypothetical protein